MCIISLFQYKFRQNYESNRGFSTVPIESIVKGGYVGNALVNVSSLNHGAYTNNTLEKHQDISAVSFIQVSNSSIISLLPT